MDRRKKKLINTQLQLRWTLWFVGITALTLLLVFSALSTTLLGMEEFRLATANGGAMDVLIRSFLTAASAGLAIAFLAGIMLSHRIAGPLYRFENFLEAVERGEQTEECHIRKNDDLHEMCELLNRVTEEKRSESSRDGAPLRKVA